MQTMDDSIYDLYVRNIISDTEALRYAQDISYIQKRLV